MNEWVRERVSDYGCVLLLRLRVGETTRRPTHFHLILLLLLFFCFCTGLRLFDGIYPLAYIHPLHAIAFVVVCRFFRRTFVGDVGRVVLVVTFLRQLAFLISMWTHSTKLFLRSYGNLIRKQNTLCNFVKINEEKKKVQKKKMY